MQIVSSVLNDIRCVHCAGPDLWGPGQPPLATDHQSAPNLVDGLAVRSTKGHSRGARQILISPSWLAEASASPVGEKATSCSAAWWPRRINSSAPVRGSQRRTV